MRDALGGIESVLVLGGRSELALAAVHKLVAQRTRKVVLAVRDTAAAAADVEAVRALGATTVEAVTFDALATDTHEQFVADTFDRFGDFDTVILAFGILGTQERAGTDAAHALEIVRANFDGAVSVLVPLAQRLRKQGHGTIVVLSSVAGLRARKANYTYGAAKAGLDAFANGLADDLVGSGVHLMVVRPGFVATRMTEGMDKAPFATTPDVVADEIVKGIAAGRTVVYAPSILRFVFLALRALPRAVWRRMPG